MGGPAGHRDQMGVVPAVETGNIDRFPEGEETSAQLSSVGVGDGGGVIMSRLAVVSAL